MENEYGSRSSMLDEAEEEMGGNNTGEDPIITAEKELSSDNSGEDPVEQAEREMTHA